MITKGALEEMIEISSRVKIKNNIKKLESEIKKRVVKIAESLNNKGMRVVGVAVRDVRQKENFTAKDEKDMILIGFLAFLDPPRESSKEAIKVLREHGIETKILTGDNDKVTGSVCAQMNLPIDNLLMGSEISKMSDADLSNAVEETNIFAKLTPDQKARVVSSLRENGHVVGFMGDGINDASAMKKADIGISVENAVDIAKEAADVILTEKDLMVLEKGIIEGRKTYANMIKYIKITASSNFGNMFSVLAASALLPFMPMASLHLILLNLIYDISSMAIPWDNVDKSFLKNPRKWEAKSIGMFMMWNGPISSIFDWIMYAILYFFVCPRFISGGLLYTDIEPGTLVQSGIFSGMNMRTVYMAVFQTGWLIECIWTQVIVMFVLRTDKIPIIQSRPSKLVTFMSIASSVFTTILPFTILSSLLSLASLPFEYFLILLVVLIFYIIFASAVKSFYIKINKSWL
jgi:Mg2+-importing ATPase